MRFLQGMSLFAMMVCAAVACYLARASASPQPAHAGPPPVTATQGSPNQEINDRYAKQFLERLAGRQNEPAERVFKNIQWLKGVPAERLLLIMNLGYSRALGVNCTHCHVEQDFASDAKRPKLAAREMAVMHRMINDQLKQMQKLESKAPARAINCSTCHRGALNPPGFRAVMNLSDSPAQEPQERGFTFAACGVTGQAIHTNSG